MTLDSLHKVMTGESTLDKEMQIGEISHRKDGDWKKVAPGKWAPVKAGGQGQMGAGEKATEQKMTNTLKDIFTAGKTDEYFSESNEDGAKRMLREDYGLSESETNKIYEQLRIMHNAKIDEENEQKADADAGRERRYNNERYGVNEKPAEQQGAEPDDDGPNTAMQNERSQFKFRKHITHAIPMGKEEEIALNRISSYFESGKRNASDAIDNYADHLIRENIETGNNNEAQERAVMRIAHAIGYGHELHDKIKRGRNGYDFGYADEQGSFYEGDDDGFLEPNITESEPDDEPPYEYDNPAPRMSELSISEETGRDKFMDKLTTFSEKYNDPSKVTVWKTEKGNWDTYYDGHRLGVIGGDQINDDLAKKLGWYQGDYSQDSAAPRLTRDTKIRLSRIKREQTQDKTYNVGETSQRKDGLYKKVAPGKWAPVKAGGSAGGAPAGGKAEVNPITGKPLRPETVAYAKQKKAEAEQKRNTEKTAGGFTLAQNDKIKNAATDVIFKRRGEKLTPADLQREYNMSEPEANEASRRINEYFSSLEKDRQKFAKAGEKKAQNAKPQASPMAGGKKTYEGSGSTKGHKWEAEKVGDKYISTHTWPDGRTDKTEITQKDYETMRTTQGGKSEAPKPASSKPSSELKYYEDMGDRVEELRSQMTTAGPEEKRRLIRESVDLQRRMQTAPFRPKKKR